MSCRFQHLSNQKNSLRGFRLEEVESTDKNCPFPGAAGQKRYIFGGGWFDSGSPLSLFIEAIISPPNTEAGIYAVSPHSVLRYIIYIITASSSGFAIRAIGNGFLALALFLRAGPPKV